MSVEKPRIILWDLETLPDLKEVLKIFPSLSDYPGQTLKATINSIICFGYKVYGEGKVECINAWDFKSWNRDVNDDFKLVKAAYEILKDADAIVTHNGTKFDWKFFQTRLMKHGLNPLDKILHIDTCRVAKNHLYLFNNRLNTLAETLTDEKKMENGGWKLWVDVYNKDPKAMKLMTEYCKQDVNVLEKIFTIIRPLSNKIPNHNMMTDGMHKACPNCGSVRIQKYGFRYSANKIRQRYLCKDCGTNSVSELKKTPNYLKY